MANTSTVRLRVCWKVGHETFRSSETASARKRRIRFTWLLLSLSGSGRGDRTRTYNRWFWRPVLCQLSYTPAVARSMLLGLPMEGVLPAARAVLVELHPVGIVLLVLARRVRPL